MFIKRILKIGLVAIVASALTTIQAQVAKPAPKPIKENLSVVARSGIPEKVKERLKAAFEKRQKRRGDAKKRGHKVHDRTRRATKRRKLW